MRFIKELLLEGANMTGGTCVRSIYLHLVDASKEENIP